MKKEGKKGAQRRELDSLLALLGLCIVFFYYFLFVATGMYVLYKFFLYVIMAPRFATNIRQHKYKFPNGLSTAISSSFPLFYKFAIKTRCKNARWTRCFGFFLEWRRFIIPCREL